MTSNLNRLFLAGGAGHPGVGTAAAVAHVAVAAPVALRGLSPALLNHILVPIRLPVPVMVNAPVANTQVGSLLEDRWNPAIRWHLPAYELVDTPDAFFSFLATATGATDVNGNPFNKGTLRLGLKKTMPPDAAAFQTAHPGIAMREVPVQISSTTLTIASKDPATGQTVRSNYPGSTVTAADGTLDVTFDNILGPGLIVLFQNLTVTGDAQLSMTGTANVVYRQATQGAPQPGSIRFLPPAASFARVTPMMMLNHPVLIPARPVVVNRPPQVPAPAPANPVNALPTYAPGTLAYAANLALGTRFGAGVYQLKFTLASTSGSRTILGAQDLKSFSLPQSEFTELKSLGDIGTAYPTLSRAYLGVVSRTIVVIPRRYAILRGKAGCEAACLALLNSAPSAVSKCKFEFTFNLAPDVSPVDLLEFSQEVSGHAELKGFEIKFPDFLAEKPAGTLQSIFQTSFHYAAGVEPHTFALSLDIRDDDEGMAVGNAGTTPAVNNANLLLSQLAVGKEPYLSGSIGLKLDDGFAEPVESVVVLNFRATGGSDDLAISVDEAAGTIDLQNHSAFDLRIARCAFGLAEQLAVKSVDQTLGAGQSLAIPLPGGAAQGAQAGFGFAADADLAVPEPMTKTDLARYLTIGVQDVVDTQFSLSVNASGIDFAGRGIDAIRVAIQFPGIPQLTPAPFSLNKLHTADGTVILVPIQSAITELNGTAQMTVQFVDSQKAPVQFTKQNDFCSQALLVLQDSDVPA